MKCPRDSMIFRLSIFVINLCHDMKVAFKAVSVRYIYFFAFLYKSGW